MRCRRLLRRLGPAAAVAAVAAFTREMGAAASTRVERKWLSSLMHQRAASRSHVREQAMGFASSQPQMLRPPIRLRALALRRPCDEGQGRAFAVHAPRLRQIVDVTPGGPVGLLVRDDSALKVVEPASSEGFAPESARFVCDLHRHGRRRVGRVAGRHGAVRGLCVLTSSQALEIEESLKWRSAAERVLMSLRPLLSFTSMCAGRRTDSSSRKHQVQSFTVNGEQQI